MRRLMFIAVVMSMTFTACNNDEFEIPSLKSEEKEISYVVTPEEAVSRLEKFLAVKGTRVSLKDVAIKMLKQSDFIPTTRSADADNPAIYLIDIPDGGCAVMGADMRLEPVYAIMDETKLSPKDLTATTTRTESTNDEDIQTFVTGLINDAVEADIMGLGPFPKDTLPLKPIPSKLDSLWTITTNYAKVDPLLDTKWDQHEPFNNNYPPVGSVLKDAGCGIIASAQIMYYHKQPSFLGGVMFDWDLLRFYEHGYHNQPLSATLEVANYVRTLANASGINLNTGTVQTPTSHQNIVTLFNAAGYSNVSFVPYTSAPYILTNIQNMLNANHPILISAKKTDDYSENGNHMWVIDGCNVYKVEYWTRVYTYVDDFTWSYNDYVDTHNYNLLHCNYGFRGRCDGYYSSRVFNTNVELPSGYIDTTVGDIEGTAQGDFSRDMSIMMYHK